MNEIKYINAELIGPHPDNPRKDLGDLSELTESIKTNGILQNLTVIPRTDGQEGYLTIIGHRRYAAGKLAGITEYPCQIIDGLTLREQVGIMLEENMQRNDLTIIEQAQGFQMMIDLGETVDTIAERTGFAKSTVYHRLNIAKLDQEILKEKQENPNFQLSITDLQALEQIEDVDARNEVLKNASNSRDITWRAKNKVDQIDREKKIEQITQKLEQSGLKKAPDSYDFYSGEWKKKKEFTLDEDIDVLELKNVEGCYYAYELWSKKFYILKRDEDFEKNKEIKEQREARQRAIREDAGKKLDSIEESMKREREEFVRGILSGKIKPLKDAEEVTKLLWSVIFEGLRRYNKDKEDVALFVLEEDCYWWMLKEDEREHGLQLADELTMLEQMIVLDYLMTEGSMHSYNNHYKKTIAEDVSAFTDILSEYGFTYSSEECYKIMNGTHELYAKEE